MAFRSIPGGTLTEWLLRFDHDVRAEETTKKGRQRS